MQKHIDSTNQQHNCHTIGVYDYQNTEHFNSNLSIGDLFLER